MHTLLASILNAMALLESHHFLHGDLRAQQIIYLPDGNVKLTHHTLVHPLKSNYLKALTQGESTYLAPELMAGLRERNITQANTFPCDVYSLGMTLIYVCTFNDPAQVVYNYIDTSINTNQLHKSIQNMSSRFSPLLAALVQMMLSDSPKDRMSFKFYADFMAAAQNTSPD